MYDVIIIGGGPAGLSAAVAAKARNKDVLVIGNGIETSSLYKAEKIDNYLGLPGVTGEEMLEGFLHHASSAGVKIINAKALQTFASDGTFMVNAGEIYEGKSVILATGIKRGGYIKGEKELLGKGVSYCATCDGMLYRGKTAVVTGDGGEMLSEALFLSEVCKRVILVSNKDVAISDGHPIEIKKGRVKAVNGDLRVASITTETETLSCDGVFIVTDAIPAESLIFGLETNEGFIVADKSMKTNVPGVFAAGDCTGKPLQISKAVGEGLVAALSAVLYIAGS